MEYLILFISYWLIPIIVTRYILPKDELLLMSTFQSIVMPYLIIAAMVFVGLGSLMTKANAQESKLGRVLKPSQNCQKTVEQQPALMGEIAIIHDPVDDVLYDYLSKNCKIPTSAQGRLIVTFNLKQDGTIDRLAVNDHLSRTISDEVLKVIKQAPITRLVKKDVLKQSARLHTLHLTFERGKILANSY